MASHLDKKKELLGSKSGNFSAVIFDIDGTVWDIFPIYYKAVNGVVEKYGLPAFEIDFLIGLLKSGESFAEKLREIKESFSLHISMEALMSEIKHIFRDLEERTVQPYPGVKPLFLHLKKNSLKIGIATGRSSSRVRLRKICRRMGIDHFIDAVASQLYVQNRKPAPDLILDCAGRLMISPERCLVIGDTKDDILAAKEAGAAAIGILSGIDNYEEMIAVKPLAVVKRLEDIVAFI